ncbi:MAG TPA: efflux RND transporter permease subunit [Chthonomonadaceae bacterium]|nr:efflux RND transporter permease subunit [Chthonomonadaceae bacterium]
MNLSRFATQNIKAVLFITLVLCGIGVWVLDTFPVGILPDVTFPRVKIIAEAGDRPTRMVEAGITRPLEESVATVPGVSHIRSATERGSCEIDIDFNWGTDILLSQQLVNTRVNETRPLLPAETRITVERMNPTVFPVYGLSLKSKTLSQSQLWNLATYTIRPRLARVPGVARTVIQGGRIPEIAVEVNPQTLQAYHLSLLDVNQALTQANIVRSIGRINRQYQQFEVLVSGETTSIDQLQHITVAQRNGVPVTLEQIADVHPSEQDPTTVVTADGVESVLINIVRQPDANTVTVVDGVKREVEAMKAALPKEAEVGFFYDQSILVHEAIQSVQEAVLIGAVLAVIVLLMFLGDIRATLVTAAIIPATVLITFLLMRLAGMTLNLMTLGALAIAIGLVIDDAIVVVENVFRHLGKGESRSAAVQRAANEIAAPMISSTLTTVVVFMPLVLLSGVAGAFFTALAVTLTIAVMVSLALALMVSPSLCAAFLKSHVTGEHHEHGPLFERFIGLYERVLRGSLRIRWLMALAVAGVIGLTLFFGSHLGTGFMPTMDEGAFILDYHSPPGTSLAESDRLLNKVEGILKETPEVLSWSRRTGTEMGFFITEVNKGDFAIMLKPDRKRGIDDVIADVRGKVGDQVAGLDVDFSQVLQDLIGDLSGNAAPVEIKLFGENKDQLDTTALAIEAKLKTIKGVTDTQPGVVQSGPELTAHVDPVRAGRVGLTPDAVSDQMEAAMLGDVVTQMLQGDRQIGVRVRFPAAYRADLPQVQQIPIRTPNGSVLPLSALADIESIPGTTESHREDQRRYLSVTGQLDNTRDLGSVSRDVQKMMAETPLPAGITSTLAGAYKSQNESFRNIAMVLCLAVLLVFAVMLFQFRSFTSPIVILLVMPLAMFGVTFGLWLTKTPLNVSSLMGAVMLVGIVVKNGILLLDRAQKAEEDGATPEEAVIQAGRTRLRPILMTTLTALLGLVPLAMGIGAGAEMQKPLAIAVIGGLAFSTVFTLVFAPLLFVTLRRMQGNREAAVEEAS